MIIVAAKPLPKDGGAVPMGNCCDGAVIKIGGK